MTCNTTPQFVDNNILVLRLVFFIYQQHRNTFVKCRADKTELDSQRRPSGMFFPNTVIFASEALGPGQKSRDTNKKAVHDIWGSFLINGKKN